MTTDAGHVRFGRYKLTECIARGGMAEVFRARHEGPSGFSREVVIKRVLPEFAGRNDLVVRFMHEAQLVAQLSHPNIVQVHDFGEVDGTLYMAMEFVTGPNLTGVLEAGRQVGELPPIGVVARLGSELAEALDYAYHFVGESGSALNIVHRDISCTNIVLSNDGVPKLLDFGIAKTSELQLRTLTGQLVGKLAYMSPEQLRQEPLDGRSDLYALGVVLYELLTGHLPFSAASQFVLMQEICGGRPKPLLKQRSNIPEALRRIVEKAIARDPADRYLRGQAMRRDLEQVIKSYGGLSRFQVADYLKDLRQRTEDDLDIIGRPSPSPSAMGTFVPTETVVPGARTWKLSATALGAAALAGLLVFFALDSDESNTTATHATVLASADEPAGLTPTLAAAKPHGIAPKDPPSAVSKSELTARNRRTTAEPRPKKKRHGRARTSPENAPVKPLAAAPPPVVATTEPPAPGTLMLVVKPWGEVFVDGKRRGTTPMAPLSLSPGKYAVRVVHPDSRRSRSQQVLVKSGVQGVLRFDLSTEE